MKTLACLLESSGCLLLFTSLAHFSPDLAAVCAEHSWALAEADPDGFPLNSRWFGYGATWIDDMDCDGWRDLAIPDQDFREPESRGVVFLLSGRDGRLLNVLTAQESVGGEWRDAASTVDLDGDGVGELVLFGSCRKERVACVRALSPSDGAVFWEQHRVPSFGWFGSITRSEDFDGDGTLDLMVLGLNSESDGADSKGAFSILSGSDGTVLVEVRASAKGELYDACSVADVDGDGLADFALSGWWKDADGGYGERVDVRSGASGELLMSFAGSDDRATFAFTLASGDLTGDGAPELLVGSTKHYFTSGGEARWPKGAVGTVSVFDLNLKERVDRFGFEQLWRSASLDPGPGHIEILPMPEGLDPGRADDLGGLSSVFPLSDSMLLVADEVAWQGEIRAYSLASGRELWKVGGEDQVDPRTGQVYPAWHLGSSLEVDTKGGREGRTGVLASNANPVSMQDQRSLWCFDLATGKLRFIVDVADIHGQAGLLPKSR